MTPPGVYHRNSGQYGSLTGRRRRRVGGLVAGGAALGGLAFGPRFGRRIVRKAYRAVGRLQRRTAKRLLAAGRPGFAKAATGVGRFARRSILAGLMTTRRRGLRMLKRRAVLKRKQFSAVRMMQARMGSARGAKSWFRAIRAVL
jgi:hypothetical protein